MNRLMRQHLADNEGSPLRYDVERYVITDRDTGLPLWFGYDYDEARRFAREYESDDRDAIVNDVGIDAFRGCGQEKRELWDRAVELLAKGGE